MNKSYLSSERNTSLSSKPSRAIQLFLMVLFLAFSGFVNAQCSITSSTSASAITCSGSPVATSSLGSCSGVLYIGDGLTGMSLGIDVNLDLTCLGPIQLIVRNKAILDFSVGSNKNLMLAAGSSIEFQTGSGMNGDSSCSASDLINIGSEKVASCNGQGGALTDFGNLVSNGGFSSINATATPICNSGTSVITAAAAPSSGATYKWYTVASGGSPVYTGNPFTTGTISTDTTYYVEASYTTPTYTSIRKAVTVKVYTTPSTPTVVTITQPNCVSSTGSVVLSGLPTSGTISQAGTVAKTYAITGTTMTISGLSAGTYNFKVSNVACSSSSSPTSNVVINAAPTTTAVWNGSAWTNGPPTISQAVEFKGNYSLSGNLSACSCTVTSGTVVFNNSDTFTVADKVIVNGGSLTFNNNASLVQINNVTNTGSITYNRITPSLIETDYTYWSSPVAPQTLNISADYVPGSFFYSYDYTIDDWAAASSSTNMVAGNGYIIRGQKPNNATYTITGTFTGVPNNGDQSVNIGTARGKSVLLGNPYPSALDADKFLAANVGVIEGTLYLWTHNTAIQLATNIALGKRGSGVYAYTSDDYASYNGVGGTATTAAPSASTGGANTNIPSGKIAVGQGFFGTINTTVVGPNTIVYNNSMRLGSTGTNNSQFFKTRKPKETIEKSRIWLNLSNEEGAFKQTLLGYVTDATNDNEARFDGQSFDGNEFVDFYSVNQDQNLVIQGRALPFDENDEVPLGYRSAIEGTFNINIEQVDGLLANQDVFIEDKLTDTEFDLKSGNYTFSTTEGTFNDRFVLKYKSSKTLGTGDFDTQAKKVLVAVKNKQIKITSSTETINKVIIYDVSGSQIYQKENVYSDELSITDLVSAHQALIVKTTLENGTTTTDKIIY